MGIRPPSYQLTGPWCNKTRLPNRIPRSVHPSRSGDVYLLRVGANGGQRYMEKLV